MKSIEIGLQLRLGLDRATVLHAGHKLVKSRTLLATVYTNRGACQRGTDQEARVRVSLLSGSSVRSAGRVFSVKAPYSGNKSVRGDPAAVASTDIGRGNRPGQACCIGATSA